MTHQRSNIVAGADYYPFGLPMENREITREDYRYGYQGQYSEKDKETGWNAFELRMYDARVARWMSADPKGQYFSPYVGMGNNPVIGTDPDGGWNWLTAGIGFAVGAGIGYAKTGDWQGALAGGLAGGLLGGASFTKHKSLISAGSQTGGQLVVKESLALTGFGKFSGQLLTSAGRNFVNLELAKEPKTEFEVLHSAADEDGNEDGDWDWFKEKTTRYPNNTDTEVVENAVILKYDAKGKLKKMVGGQKSTITDEYGNEPKVYRSKLQISPLMREWIQGAIDYHCGGCKTSGGVLTKYRKFIFSRTSKELRRNRLNAVSSPHR